ncbi:hypothetical protein [Paraburkholderia sp. MM6662-R1]|uniref:hypothetical protein n=1 Tax=Paraburkholderia sp. MM6662-R1 TaxID=2991066 RepID=UPI003D1AB639
MTISKLSPLPIGNALRIFLEPPPSALLWRVLRTTQTSFVDEDDPNAVVVFQGDQQKYLVDTDGLVNDAPYTYGAFYFDGTSWTPSDVVTATPTATYSDQTTDVLSLVRERLDVGLQIEVARGSLSPQSGAIAVLNAPPAFDDTRFPVVTVQVVSDGSRLRAIGELVSEDERDALTGQFTDAEGWLAHTQLSVIGWSKNADERIALRKVIRRLVIGNLAVFDAAGMDQIDFTQTDVNEMSQQPPLYASEGTFTCVAPAVVLGEVGPVTDVSVTASAVPPPSSDQPTVPTAP